MDLTASKRLELHSPQQLKGLSPQRVSDSLFERISRELTPEELSNPNVQTIQKLLLHLLDRAELELSELRRVVQQALEAEKQCAVLQAQAVPRRALEIGTVQISRYSQSEGKAQFRASYILTPEFALMPFIQHKSLMR